MRNYKSYIKNSLTKKFPWKLALVVMAIFYIKEIVGYFKSTLQNESVETRENEIETQNLDYNVGITKIKAKELANVLLDAFNYNTGGMVLGGTDKTAIAAVFNSLNENNDYRKIHKEFGLKLYNGQGLADENSLISKMYDKLDLTSWLRAELDFLDFSLNSLVKTKITNSGLTY
jgi:hypothetical protein